MDGSRLRSAGLGFGGIRVPSRVLGLPLSRSTDRLRRAPAPIRCLLLSGQWRRLFACGFACVHQGLTGPPPPSGRLPHLPSSGHVGAPGPDVPLVRSGHDLGPVAKDREQHWAMPVAMRTHAAQPGQMRAVGRWYEPRGSRSSCPRVGTCNEASVVVTVPSVQLGNRSSPASATTSWLRYLRENHAVGVELVAAIREQRRVPCSA
jgi:hypothetical protein